MAKNKILFVDDERTIVILVKNRLKKNGYEVITAGDGEEALEKCRSNKPDLAILDINMPKINGFQLCRLLREDEKLKDIPIIVLSAFVRDKVGENSAVADVYIRKPFEPEDLLGAIKRLLETEGPIPRGKIS
ncbi:MAG: response regulator [Candidatus Omnitrophota bacterium]|nr:response regulator [Candidatus Omnitrophota bacterium]